MNTINNQSGALAISRGRITRPQKAVIYGPEGVGKSTFASLTPSPVFLDTEGGTHHLDVIRLDAASSWDEITAAVAQLAKAQHPFRTLVIDTADWLEKRLAEHLCRKANKDSIEDFGYGKGWVLLTEEFARFLNSLDALLARGMNVVFLAHSTVKKFEAPDQAGSYDRFELKLSKQVAPLLKEWADVVLFANYVTRIAEKDSGKTRGVGGKERVLYTTHAAAYDAKNRHGLPDKLPFSIDALAPVFGSSPATACAGAVSRTNRGCVGRTPSPQDTRVPAAHQGFATVCRNLPRTRVAGRACRWSNQRAAGRARKVPARRDAHSNQCDASHGRLRRAVH